MGAADGWIRAPFRTFRETDLIRIRYRREHAVDGERLLGGVQRSVVRFKTPISRAAKRHAWSHDVGH
jgi:hypothetical protein